jgi:hypothetical protein
MGECDIHALKAAARPINEHSAFDAIGMMRAPLISLIKFDNADPKLSTASGH